MISCKHVDSFLDDYLAGKLALATSLKFRAHLALCSACRRYLNEYRRAVDAAGQLSDVERPTTPIPDELVNSIAKLMAKDDASQRPG